MEPQCTAKLKALADETRWQIVQWLLQSPLTVSEIASKLQISQYNISKHLRILRECGIIVTVKEGRHVRSDIAPRYRMPLGSEQRSVDFGCCQFHFGRPLSLDSQSPSDGKAPVILSSSQS